MPDLSQVPFTPVGSHKGVYIFVVSIYRSSGGRSGRKNDGSERDDEKDRIMTHIAERCTVP